MDDQLRTVLSIAGRVFMVVLCYFVAMKKMKCGDYCSLFRQRLQSTLGWVSGAVATLGLFYPVICGLVAVVLLVAIFATDLDYGTKTSAVRITSKPSTIGDAGSPASS